MNVYKLKCTVWFAAACSPNVPEREYATRTIMFGSLASLPDLFDQLSTWAKREFKSQTVERVDLHSFSVSPQEFINLDS